MDFNNEENYWRYAYHVEYQKDTNWKDPLGGTRADHNDEVPETRVVRTPEMDEELLWKPIFNANNYYLSGECKDLKEYRKKLAFYRKVELAISTELFYRFDGECVSYEQAMELQVRLRNKMGQSRYWHIEKRMGLFFAGRAIYHTYRWDKTEQEDDERTYERLKWTFYEYVATVNDFFREPKFNFRIRKRNYARDYYFTTRYAYLRKLVVGRFLPWLANEERLEWPYLAVRIIVNPFARALSWPAYLIDNIQNHNHRYHWNEVAMKFWGEMDDQFIYLQTGFFAVVLYYWVCGFPPYWIYDFGWADFSPTFSMYLPFVWITKLHSKEFYPLYSFFKPEGGFHSSAPLDHVSDKYTVTYWLSIFITYAIELWNWKAIGDFFYWIIDVPFRIVTGIGLREILKK